MLKKNISLELLSEIERHLASLSSLELEDLSELKEALVSLHSLYGVLSMFGESNLAQEIREVEEAFLKNLAAPNTPLLKKLRGYVVDFIKAFINDLPLPPPTESSLSEFFQPYSELITELASQQDKKIKQLSIVCNNLTVPLEVMGALSTVFIHLFRNAVDHGIEKKQERLKKEKEESGNIAITLEVNSQKKSLNITLSDDGRGIDPEIISQIYDFGYTTKKSFSEISGRGVGLHAVKKVIDRLGGEIRVQSTPGKGTTFTLLIPYLK
jgi:chemotaxis protein histidine kinase CheA